MQSHATYLNRAFNGPGRPPPTVLGVHDPMFFFLHNLSFVLAIGNQLEI